MKKFIALVIFGATLFFEACKKEETQTCTCPEPEVPYQSIRSNGDTADKIRVSIVSGSNENSECTGNFMIVRGVALVDPGVDYYKIISPIPDSVKNNTTYGNTEWLVDVTYLGVGIECYLMGRYIDPLPGDTVYPNDIELVEVSNYELYP